MLQGRGRDQLERVRRGCSSQASRSQSNNRASDKLL